MDIARSSLQAPFDHSTADDPTDVARLTVDGRGADRELDALAGWLRGTPLTGGGWRVSRLRPDASAAHPQLGAGDADTLGVVIQSGLGLAQLIVAVWAWWGARAAKGRSDLVITVIYLGKETVIGESTQPPPDPTAPKAADRQEPDPGQGTQSSGGSARPEPES